MSEPLTSSKDWEVISENGEQADTIKFTVRNRNDHSQCYQNTLCNVYGTPYPPMVSKSRWNLLDPLVKYRESDIVICTYPKCGTTWMEQVVLLLICKGDSSQLNPASKNSYVPGINHLGKVWIEAAVEQDPSVALRMGDEGMRITFEQFENINSPRVVKNHSPSGLFLGCHQQSIDVLEIKPKIIIVTRNPFDACVSSYYHAWNPHKCGWPFTAWATLWLNGGVAHGSWFDWVRGWNDTKKNYPNHLLWVQYEDIKVDPHRTVSKVAKYLGLDLSDEIIQKVVDESTFDSMKEQATSKGGDIFGHLRKGVVGDWTGHFSKELFDEFNQKYLEFKAETGLSYDIGSSEL